MLALQRSAGNQAAGRAARRRDFLGIGNALGDAFDARDNEDQLDAEEELEDFRNGTYAPLTDHKPSSDVGLFDAACNMRAGTMTITLKVAYNFTAGDPTKVSAGFRPGEFQWTPQEQAEWKARYMREVGAMWSAQFTISNTKPHWTAMTVATTVNVIEDAGDPHFTLTVAKYPPDAGMAQSSICPPGFHHNAATGNCSANTAADDESGTGELDSNDMRPEQKLDWGNASAAIPFTKGSGALGPAGTAALAPIITAVAGVAGAHVEITGHASNTHRAGRTAADGAIDNMDLARQRTAAVQTALIAGGCTADQVLVRNVGEEGAGAGDEWCRVDAQVGTQRDAEPGPARDRPHARLRRRVPADRRARGHGGRRQVRRDDPGPDRRRRHPRPQLRRDEPRLDRAPLELRLVPGGAGEDDRREGLDALTRGLVSLSAPRARARRLRRR